MRIVMGLLFVVQVAVVVLCILGVVEACTVPYHSEWLAADAFVPYLLAVLVLLVPCMWLTGLRWKRTKG